MLIAVAMIAAVTIGGAALTYLDREPWPLALRVAAGTFLGCVVMALAAVVLGGMWGMTPATVAGATVIAASPLLIFCWSAPRRQAIAETSAAGRRVPLAGWIAAAVLALVTLLLVATFRQAMIETADGILTRSLANRLDLTLHLAIITSFLDGNNFHAGHPEFAGAPLTYPFLVDLGAALLARTGISIGTALLLQNTVMVVALVVVIYHWARALTLPPEGGSHEISSLEPGRFAAICTTLLVLFGSGLGWLVMLQDLRRSGAPLRFFLELPHSYTLNTANLQWGNLVTIILLPQRSLQLGLPLVLMSAFLMWRVVRRVEGSRPFGTVVLAGLMIGFLPLAHTHSFGVALLAAGAIALLFPRHWRSWTVMFAVAAAVALPQLLWITHGATVRAGSFVQWQPGWAKGPEAFPWFWFKNTGLFIPLLLAAYVLPRFESPGLKPRTTRHEATMALLRRFCLPALLFFIIPNLFRVAPRVWDNNKVLVYWYIWSAPLVGLLLARLWERRASLRLVAAGLLLSLTLAGLLDTWRVAAGTVTVTVFDRGATDFARMVEESTEPGAIVAHAPTATHPVLLTGRPSWLGYAARVKLHGLDTSDREADLACIYTGCPDAQRRMTEHNIRYVVVGPDERKMYQIGDSSLQNFSLVRTSGDYALYRTTPRPE